MQKAEIKGLLERALREARADIAERTPGGETEYFDYDIRHEALPGGEVRARFFVWELTPDKSAKGRPVGEHKIQLTLGERDKKPKNFPTAEGRLNLLLGYSEQSGLFAGFQAELHKNFAWSKLVAVRREALETAAKDGWATHLRGKSPNTGQRELAIVFKPAHAVDWLRFTIEHAEVYGAARQAAAASWITEPPEPPAAPVEAIPPAELPAAKPEDVVQDPEALGVITGDLNIAANAETATIQVNLAERIAATNRHNALVLGLNNRIHDVLGDTASVIDRDLPGHRRTYPGAAVQPDLGIRIDSDDQESYLVAEAKSLPQDVGGQWRQVMIGIGELSRYSAIYNERFNAWPTKVLALEWLPEDPDLQRFLRNLWDNEDISVVWPEGEKLRTFSSHHDAIAALAEPVD